MVNLKDVHTRSDMRTGTFSAERGKKRSPYKNTTLSFRDIMVLAQAPVLHTCLNLNRVQTILRFSLQNWLTFWSLINQRSITNAISPCQST